MNSNSNGSNSNSNGHSPQDSTPQTGQSESQFDEVAQIQQQADLAIEALHQAGLANSAAAVKRHADRLGIQVGDLTQTYKLLLDPDLPHALAELRAAREINDRLGKRQPLPYTPVPRIQIEIPEIPTFGRFYSSAGGQPSQAALPSGSSTSPSPIDATTPETPSNGKQPAAAGKGFGEPQKNS